MVEQNGATSSHALTVQWVGDIALNESFCNPQHHAALSQNLADISNGLGPCDLRIGNWESPLWGDGGVNVLKEPRLCTTPDAAACILPFGLDVALLANNHAYDCLEQGFENTIRFLDDNKIRWLGVGRTETEAAQPLIVTRHGWRIGLVNYIAADTHPNVPPNSAIFLNMLEEERLLSEVRSLAPQVDVTLVNLHWGVDYFAYPTVAQRRLARAAIDAGATVVVGHHTHCLQGHEKHGNGYIFYSLGNFLFDSLYGTSPWSEQSRQTAVASAVISKKGVEKAYLTNLHQEGLRLEWDDRSCRRRAECRLNRPLRLTDAKYARFWRRRQLYQELFVRPIQFISDAGGPFRAMARLRWRHAVKVAGLLRRRSVRRSG